MALGEMAHVTKIDYDTHLMLVITIEGHPSQSIDLAHQLGELILGRTRRWHFMSIEGRVPEDYTHPSEMLLTFVLQGFE